MAKYLYAVAFVVFASIGCELTITQPPSGTPAPATSSGPRTVGDVTGNVPEPDSAARTSPATGADPIILAITNTESVPAVCRITMTLVGTEVHFSFKRIPAGGQVAVIGPERADQILVETVFEGSPPVTLDAITLYMGRDYSAGEVVRLALALPPAPGPPGEPNQPPTDEGGEPNEPNNPPPPPPPPSPQVVIIGLDANVTVQAGDTVAFALELSDYPSDGVVRVLADPDTDLGNGNERVIFGPVAAAGSIPVVWDTTDVPSGSYTIRAVLSAGGQSLDSDLAAGLVTVTEPPPPPLPAPTIAVINLDGNYYINPGAIIAFAIRVADVPDGATIHVFVDPDQQPASGDETEIGVLTAPTQGVVQTYFDTTAAQPATYSVYAELWYDSRSVRSDYAPGTIRVNALPSIQIITPATDLTIGRVEYLSIEWAGGDADDNAQVGFFLDPDNTLNGNELPLVTNLAEDDPNSHAFAVSLFDVPRGSYRLVAVMADMIYTATDVGPMLCVTSGRTGSFNVADLAAIERTIITGGDPNYAPGGPLRFGADVDLADVDGDRHGELLATSPDAQNGFGLVHYHVQASGLWPPEMTSSDLLTTIEGDLPNAGTGNAAAFVPPMDPNSAGGVVIGAPWADNGMQTSAGMAYMLDYGSINTGGWVNLMYQGTRIAGSRPHANLGFAIASMPDVDGDGYEELAITAPSLWSLDPNMHPSVAVVYGGHGLPSGSLQDIGVTIPGVVIIGESPGDETGFAITGTPGMLARKDTRQNPIGVRGDVLIGAPGADGEAGRVYAVSGASIGTQPRVRLADRPADWQGVVFHGEPPDPNDPNSEYQPRAGHSVAVLDFNGDGTPDIAIGAPGVNGGAGRVYIVYGLPSNSWPADIYLADVGSTVAGLRIDGSGPFAGLGMRLARASDVDGDGFEDLLMAAPYARAPDTNTNPGAVYLIYGGSDWPGAISVTELGAACDRPGWAVYGTQDFEEFGVGLAGGVDLNMDGTPDVAVGAPGYTDPVWSYPLGRVYLLFTPVENGPAGGD